MNKIKKSMHVTFVLLVLVSMCAFGGSNDTPSMTYIWSLTGFMGLAALGAYLTRDQNKKFFRKKDRNPVQINPAGVFMNDALKKKFQPPA